jgi:predicted XRE-type DNA-binding protein
LIEAAMERRSCDNLREAIEDDAAQAANMSMRSRLMIAIEQRVRKCDIAQAEAARRRAAPSGRQQAARPAFER